MSRWPADNQASLVAFYGNPGGRMDLVQIKPPFKMYYDGKHTPTLSFHRKAAPALLAAFNEIWEYYGKDQSQIDALGISKHAGTFNPRYIRGRPGVWSNHAYGAAIDINAEENGFGAGKGNIPKPVIAAFKRQGARWGGDYKGRTDPMHFEFCGGGEILSQDEASSDIRAVLADTASPKPDFARPLLKLGSKGGDVAYLQRMIGVVETNFGAKTDLAVRKFQKNHGLLVDGKVGPNTWRAIEA